jgi:peptidoglycan/LPS O-acetylase OafA/YrhL
LIAKPDAFHLRYRRELDGLRAIAVLAVVASHIQLHFFDGGFVGVDVFFVISGYLIGSILLREVAAKGRIDYAEFYERRIRRIMPALLTMLVAVAAVAYLVFLPKDLIEFSKMGAAALLFSANIYLSRSGGYFDFEAANNFLTHTWSLGVEEQFYIVLPPLLMLFRRKVANGTIGTLIAWIAGISFAVSIPAAYLAPTGTFYLLPTRIWELLLGTLTYLHAGRIGRLSPRMQGVLAWIGLLAICLPIVFYSRQIVFPGLSALPPCAGAALLIATGATLVHRMLSWRGCVLIGQISYSLYLWHWPIVVYNRMYPLSSNPHVVKLAILALSLAIAYGSWRWIETPFRQGRLRPSRKTLFALSGGLSGAVLIFFLAIVMTRGAAYRFSPAEQGIASYRQSGGSIEHFRVGQCFIERPTEANLPDWNECLKPDPSRPNYLLLGSSLIAQLRDALQQTYPGIHFLQATSPSCAVRSPASQDGGKGCPALMRFIFADYLAHTQVDAVLFQVEPGDPSPETLSSVLDFFRERGIRVYAIGSQVQYERPEPALAIASISSPRTSQGFRLEDHFREDPRKDEATYRAAIEREGGTYLSMFETLCPDGHCRAFAEPGIPMETDQEHLSYAGALYVARAWRDRGVLH